MTNTVQYEFVTPPKPSTSTAGHQLTQLTSAAALNCQLQVASKPAFHALRTQQRLGYSVSLHGHRMLGGVHSLAVRIQSPHTDPETLRTRVAEWLVAFRQQLAGRT